MTGFDIGGSPITSYNLQWDANSNGLTWSDLKGQDGSLDTATTFTKSALTGGLYYKFKLQAKNIQGWSTFSAVVSYQAAQWPDKPNVITSSLVQTSIRISWTAPANNFKTITKYKVVIQNTDATDFVETVSYCDGSNSIIFNQLHCDVPVITILR